MQISDYFRIKNAGIEVLVVKNTKFNAGPHSHVASYVLHLLAAGEIQVQRQGRPCVLRPGDVLPIRPFEVHSIVAASPYTLISLILPARMLRETGRRALAKAAGDAVNILPDLAPASAAALLALARSVKYRQQDENAVQCAHDILKAARRYIDAPEEKMTLSRQAAEAGFDKYYYLRLFKRQLGLTPHQFQIQSRVRKARALLEQNVPVIQAALQTGFYDQSHFTREFKKSVGLSPRKYQKTRMINLHPI